MDAQPSIEDRISASLNPVDEAPKEATELTEEPAEAPEPEAVEETPQEAPEAAEEGGEEDTDDIPSLSGLSDLAEHLGVEVAELYNLAIPVTTSDGERTEVTLSEWKDAYQARDKYERTRQEAAEAKARLEEQYSKAQEAAETYARQAEAAIQVANQQLLQEFQSVDWNRLQTEEPARWAMLRQQYQERSANLQAAYAQAQNQFQKARQETEQRRAAEYQELLQKEREALLRAIPELKDESAYKAETRKLADYMKGLGFQEHEIAGLADHRTAVAFRKAMLYDESKKKGDAVKQQVKIGQKKVLKPGARQSKEVHAKEKVNQAKARVRKTGKMHDAADAISTLLNL